ncbi:protein kinase family protein [Roseospira navarrensis]|uniref:Protein kinase family protein n=1 Tax=Roseospira navarrensis TaxID=140058 RepID=A0A7X1ZEU5_9PROT|nr:protein kinase family protein [Roseospira navarrensis]MQX36993.1 protein kinase family protein [Roseospira navarrensis]
MALTAQSSDSGKQADSGATSGTLTGQTTMLRDRFAIYYESPIPDLDTANATAFAAEDRRQRGRPLFALVVTGPLPARVMIMKHLKGVRAAGLMPLMEWGPVDWPPQQAIRLALIYEKPAGRRIVRRMGDVIKAHQDQQFAKTLLRPLVMALGELHNNGVMHRAVRPTNLFYADAAESRIVLGDCATGPVALDQPVACETIESGMCQPEGRGAGNLADDFYALGASAVMLLTGRNPLIDVADDEIVKRKLTQGSYATLVSDQRVPLNMIEVLRGLLADDKEQRWDFEQLDLWFNGRRMSPVQAKPLKRAQRAFVFMNQEFLSPRHLAHEMATHWDKAAPIVLEGKLEIWLRRGLEDNQLADQVAMAIRNAAAGSQHSRGGINDLALANVLIVMDPDAPIRFRGFRAHMDGFGGVLSAAIARGQDTKPFTEVILAEIPKMWLGVRDHFSPEYVQLDGTFRELREFLIDGVNKGSGLERCLYEMNESQQCMSKLFEKDLVLTIRDVLPALDRLGARMDSKTHPLDRHVVAFVAARFPKEIGPQLLALNESDPKRSTLGMLSLLAVLQWRLGPEAVHGLCSWVGGLMGPIINSYQSRERRRWLEREIPRLVRKGSLPELYNFVDDAEERKSDFDEYRRARAEWSAANHQIKALESGQVGADENAERMGEKAAATGSVGIAIVTVAIVLAGYLL